MSRERVTNCNNVAIQAMFHFLVRLYSNLQSIREGEGFWEATQVNSNAVEFTDLANNATAGFESAPSCGFFCDLTGGERFDRISDVVYVQPVTGDSIRFDILANNGVHSAYVWSPETKNWTHHIYDIKTKSWGSN